MRTESWLSAH